MGPLETAGALRVSKRPETEEATAVTTSNQLVPAGVDGLTKTIDIVPLRALDELPETTSKREALRRSISTSEVGLSVSEPELKTSWSVRPPEITAPGGTPGEIRASMLKLP